MRPVFSSSLPLKAPGSPYRSQSTTLNNTWPTSYPLAEANIIFVAPDWSDLESTLQYLEENPSVSRDIARRSREGLVDSGYLSTAAEVCYWRALIRGWSRVVRVEGQEWSAEGTRWETYSLTGSTDDT
jgi:hypothetical protein